MSRTIKFQAWHQASKTMFDWCEFSLNGRNNCIIHVTEGVFTTEKVDDNSVILREYTGLMDSQGKPIYEGDIVNFTYWWFDGQERETNLTGAIVYDSELLSFALNGIKNEEWIRHIGGQKGGTDRSAFAFFRFDEDNFEVIGNIHQNPELLK